MTFLTVVLLALSTAQSYVTISNYCAEKREESSDMMVFYLDPIILPPAKESQNSE
jgi:hypothetical protein